MEFEDKGEERGEVSAVCKAADNAKMKSILVVGGLLVLLILSLLTRGIAVIYQNLIK